MKWLIGALWAIGVYFLARWILKDIEDSDRWT